MSSQVYVQQIFDSLNTDRHAITDGPVARVSKSRAKAMLATGCWEIYHPLKSKEI